MSVWFCIPSCRPVAECGPRLEQWRKMGYRVALLRQGRSVGDGADIEIPTLKYLGWAKSTNILARLVLAVDDEAQWIVGGGDDYLPDPDIPPESIGAQCKAHFSGTFGVMQPTGDRWGDDAYGRAMFGEDRGAMLDRIAGSPWLGRQWCERAYGGNGPMYAGHFHCWADEELQLVAEKLGRFWQLRAIVQKHEHWLRENNDTRGRTDVPQSWEVADRDYRYGREQFEHRKRLGFPGHEPK